MEQVSYASAALHHRCQCQGRHGKSGLKTEGFVGLKNSIDGGTRDKFEGIYHIVGNLMQLHKNIFVSEKLYSCTLFDNISCVLQVA